MATGHTAGRSSAIHRHDAAATHGIIVGPRREAWRDDRKEEAMERGVRAELVERYKEGTRVFAEALEGITDVELDARSEPGEWTAREVVHHMADSEMTSAIRLRRLIAEDAPTIQGYDQEEYAQRLFYGERPIEGSSEAVAAARRTTGDILDRLTDEQWARSGTHTESGPYGVEAWLEIYAAHAHDHADQIRRARESAQLG
jgi:DinB family protein